MQLKRRINEIFLDYQQSLSHDEGRDKLKEAQIDERWTESMRDASTYERWID